MKISILTSCTGAKKYSPDGQLTQDDFLSVHDQESFEKIEEKLIDYKTSAEDIYTGQQHVRLMEAVKLLREKFGGDSVDLHILSAGYGIIPGKREVVPYECTFQGMKASEIDEWGAHLNVPEDARKFLSTKADLTLVLLGDSYLRSLSLDDSIQFSSPTVFLASKNAQKRIKGSGKQSVIALGNPEAKRYSFGLVGLKGQITLLIANRLLKEGQSFIDQLFDESSDIYEILDEELETLLGLQKQSDKTVKKGSPKKSTGRKGPFPNPKVDYTIEIKDSWWKSSHKKKLQYFIPEWDDLVDPDYDFETDTHSGGSGDWSNQVYAHQMYPSPNYDGILISKIVAEKSKKKKERINEMGVHRYLRVPRNFPIMGDCGAFGYIKEEVPIYTTSEILEYYTRLDFDSGVSIDHLIVTATEEQRDFRYELTINNAEEFIREHNKLGLSWTPIGAVQGWSPESYAEAARQYVAMGYKVLALGGLVRTQTKKILEILIEVHKVVPPDVHLHLFGIARLDDMYQFNKLGVRSVDSASHLRKAWLGELDNYWAMDGEKYAAIRIPEGGKSFRAKRIVTEGRATAEQVLKLEQACIETVREFDKGSGNIENILDTLDEYDQLISPDRRSRREVYQRTLIEQPWKKCPCSICQQDGVEVIIFRGNNRNRRRGFHNTFVFYSYFKKVIAGEDVVFGGKKIEPKSYQLSLFGGSNEAKVDEI